MRRVSVFIKGGIGFPLRCVSIRELLQQINQPQQSQQQLQHGDEHNQLTRQCVHPLSFYEGAQRPYLTLTLPVGIGAQLSDCIVALQAGALPAAPPVRQSGLEIGLALSVTI